MINILKKYAHRDKPRIIMLPLYLIAPNPYQPRRYFDPQTMEELRDSIIEYGFIQPVTVRCVSGEYELVSGERRFRAAQMAGLEEIPAVIIDADEDKSAILALLENLQREDLSFFEIAESYRNLIRNQGMSQAELAFKMGETPASVSNKIRLLRLQPLVKKLIRDYDLTEGHARALLLLRNEDKQLEAVKIVCRDNLNVTQTEQLVRKINSGKHITGEHIDEIRVTRANDVKVFKNTVSKAIELMRKSGIEADMEETSFDWGMEYIIKIKKEEKAL